MRPLLPSMLALLLFGCASSWRVEDQDGDGLTVAEGDCWDARAGPEGSALSGADIHPGAAETWYDGIDQDCSGDDDFDADGDGVVPLSGAGQATLGVPGTGALPAGDCWDTGVEPPPDQHAPVAGATLEPAEVYPGAIETWYDGIDQDCAGDDDFDQDGDGFTADGDCDDTDPDVKPGAEETWYDGIDQDCAGDDDFDQDGDGFAAGEHGGSDCDDTNPARQPDGSPERYYDGLDKDCDTRDGDGDADGDGWWALDYADRVAEEGGSPLVVPEGAEGDCWDDPDTRPDAYVAVNLPPLQADEVHPGAEERHYDAVDQDCAGDLSQDFDQDGDGHPTDQYHDRDGDLGDDCQDANAAINPGQQEDCATSADDDCSGSTNDTGALDCTLYYQDADLDGHGRPDLSRCTCVMAGTYTATSAGDCLDAGTDNGVAASAIHPDATEVCNGADDDCDNAIDDADGSLDTSTADRWYADADGDGYGNAASSQLRCLQPSGHVADDMDCDDANASANPGATEVCDLADTDEDCDGLADDDDGGASGTSTWYADDDADGHGDPDSTRQACELPSGYTSSSDDCDDSRAGVNPSASELCSTTLLDDDCDGSINEPDATDTSIYYADADLDGYGDAASTTEACAAPSGFVDDDTDCDDADPDVNPGAEDDADDVDSDCDAWIDEASVLPGDLIVTEILTEPAGTEPQWFEVYNAGGNTLHLDGWRFFIDLAGLDFCISPDAGLSVAPGDRLVLCAADGEAGCDYSWEMNGLGDFSATCPAGEPGFALEASGDELLLSLAGSTIDAVDWSSGSWPGALGASMELGESLLDASSNDSASSWCMASSVYTTDNTGTPGDSASCTP